MAFPATFVFRLKLTVLPFMSYKAVNLAKNSYIICQQNFKHFLTSSAIFPQTVWPRNKKSGSFVTSKIRLHFFFIRTKFIRTSSLTFGQNLRTKLQLSYGKGQEIEQLKILTCNKSFCCCYVSEQLIGSALTNKRAAGRSRFTCHF